MADKTRAERTKKRVFNSVRELTDEICEAFLELTSKAHRGNFYLALSGGRTPGVIYERLAGEPYLSRVRWDHIHFFWGDERCVPPAHPESNFAMASENILSKLDIPPGNIHRIMGENQPREEAGRYEKEIRKTIRTVANDIPRFDLILLGLGLDGHTASLFPGDGTLDETERLCLHAIHPASGQMRITFTLPLINNAARVWFIVTGNEKSEILSAVLKGTTTVVHYPAAMVKPRDGILEWWTDISGNVAV